MKVETRLFGTIDIGDEKIITFPEGIVGFYYMKKFALIRNEENEDASIMWLQSMDEPQYALPVLEPSVLGMSYNPVVNDEYLAPLGELAPEQTYSLVTLTVPSDITQMTANMKAPIVINMANNLAVQIIVEDDYQVKHPIYETLRQRKEGVAC
jgi:flagellar assembly factor FliW